MRLKIQFKAILIVAIIIFSCQNVLAQGETDSAYIKDYPQRISVRTFLGSDFLLLTAKNKQYSPNVPLLVGAGFSVKNSVFNIRLNQGLFSLNDKERGKSEITDFQIHNFRKKLIIDLFFQKHKSFYQNENGTISLYPDLALSQIGAEASYIFNWREFSAKAAFDASEQQLKSAGSYVIGGGAYYYHLGLDEHFPLKNNTGYIENFQLGINGGYAYSWVINKHWMMSGMATVGLNIGNDPKLLKNVNLDLYPTAFARGSGIYHKSDWAVSMSMLIHNKSLYYFERKNVSSTIFNLELTYVKHLDGLFRKKK